MNARFAEHELWPIDRLKPNPKNARVHPPEQIERLRHSLRTYGWTLPALVDENGDMIAGHGRVEAAKLEGYTQASVIIARGWTAQQKREYALLDNRVAEGATWNQDLLRIELGELQGLGLDLNLIGFGGLDLQAPQLLAGLGVGDPATTQAPPAAKPASGSLADKFFAVPFSVINAREGWWQNRKQLWLGLGIQSELGRGENLLKMSDTALEPDPEKRKVMVARREAKQATAGNGWANGGPARRDAAFYAKKREWEAANGRKISTKEFREKFWDGYREGTNT